MSQSLPKGYKVIYVKEKVTQDTKEAEPKLPKMPKQRHPDFYIGDMYNELYPLDLLTKISVKAGEVYDAEFVAVGSFLRKVFQ